MSGKASELTKARWPHNPIPSGGKASPSDVFDVKKAANGKGTQISEPAAAKAVKIPS